MQVPLVTCTCSSLARPAPREAEEALREVFSGAGRLAREGGVVLDAVECAGGRRGRGKTHQGRMTAQLQALLYKKVDVLVVVGHILSRGDGTGIEETRQAGGGSECQGGDVGFAGGQIGAADG